MRLYRSEMVLQIRRFERSLGRVRSWSKDLVGTVAFASSLVVLSSMLLVVRSHISVATSALVLVVPVVVGVVVGGFRVGVGAVAVGFLVYDYFFIPPYYTLNVGGAANWVALIVYGAVVALVMRVVSSQTQARSLAVSRAQDIQRLSEISQRLLSDRPLEAILPPILDELREGFELLGAAILLPHGGQYELAFASGEALSDDDIALLIPRRGGVGTLARTEIVDGVTLRMVPLVSGATVLGALVIRGHGLMPYRDDLIRTFSSSLAVFMHQHELRIEALRNVELEERDRWRRALLSSVSHDLRTPLASMKTSVSTLREFDGALEPSLREELLGTIERQADRLSKLVSNLLDSSRIEANTLIPRSMVIDPREVVEEALAQLSPKELDSIHLELAPELPSISVDHILVSQSLSNLVENALRYCEGERGVLIWARKADRYLELGVLDHGVGVDPAIGDRIFERFEKGVDSPGAGLGLWIAKSFIELNGGTLAYREPLGGGSEFVVTFPLAGVDNVGD